VADDLRAVGVGAREATVPPLLDHLDDDDVVLAGLVVYFALLATVGLVHALATSVRRRRGLFAVWRTLGLTPAQVRRSVLTQATVVVGGGLLVGVPLGLAAGRVTWALVIGDLGVLDSPTTPGPALMLTAAAAVVTGLAVATPPARRAARRRPGPDLREP